MHYSKVGDIDDTHITSRQNSGEFVYRIKTRASSVVSFKNI